VILCNHSVTNIGNLSVTQNISLRKRGKRRIYARRGEREKEKIDSHRGEREKKRK